MVVAYYVGKNLKCSVEIGIRNNGDLLRIMACTVNRWENSTGVKTQDDSDFFQNIV